MPWVAEGRSGLLARTGGGLAGGLLVAASLPPFGIWPLALAGVALVAAACAGAPWRLRTLAGFAAGVGQLGVGLAFAARFTLLGAGVLVVVEAGFFALACLLAPAGRGRLAGLAGLLTLAEAARERWPFGGLPLGGIALGQAGGPLLAVARLGGPVALAGATYLAGAGLAALARRREQRERRERRAGLVAVGTVAALAVLATLAPSGGPPGPAVPVALVQGGGPRGLDALQVPAGQAYAATLAPTERLRPGRFALVVWPEDVVRLPGPLAGSPEARQLSALARHLRTTLVAGVTRPVGATRFDNELVAWGPSGRLVARFEKAHPVPFGEYVPFRSLVAHLASLADVPRDAVVGHGSGMVETAAGPLALLVSFEDFFTARGRSGVHAGGRLLVLATNTASYRTSQVPAEELAASRIQAVAEGRALVQAATTGYSALVEPSGAVAGGSALGARTVVPVVARLRSGATPYDTIGSGPALGAAALLAAAGIGLGARDRRRVRRGREPPATAAGPAGSADVGAEAPVALPRAGKLTGPHR